MLVTEEQASGMVCPRLSPPLDDGVSPVGCLGSRCMFWRWHEDKPRRRFLDGGDVSKGQHAGVGFCGAAGFPDVV